MQGVQATNQPDFRVSLPLIVDQAPSGMAIGPVDSAAADKFAVITRLSFVRPHEQLAWPSRAITYHIAVIPCVGCGKPRSIEVHWQLRWGSEPI